MAYDVNPFPIADYDRHALWEILVRKDIEGFLARDWRVFADYFKPEGFIGLDAGGSLDPKDWTLAFPTVAAYGDAWLKSACLSAQTLYAEPRRDALFRAATMTDIHVAGECATARKTFNDGIALPDGRRETLQWQSVFFCCKLRGEWKISGFVGYLPYPYLEANSCRVANIEDAP